jgi:putative ABC transport system permease protein
MNLFRYSLKNISERKAQSIVFVLFISVACTVLIFFNCFVYTIANQSKGSIKTNLTGKMIIRSSKDEGEIYTSSGSWGNIIPLTDNQINSVISAFNSDDYEIVKRIRMNMEFENDVAKVSGIVMSYENNSIDDEFFDLNSGRMISADDKNSVIITPEQARSLNADVGDKINAIYTTEAGQAEKEVEIIGIGETELLLGMVISYIDYDLSKEMLKQAGQGDCSATELLAVEMKDNISKDEAMNKINASLDGEHKLSVTFWDEASDFLIGMINLYSAIIYIFILLLMIVIFVLILNLILVSGLERRIEVGTLRAIGFSKKKVLGIFLTEYGIISVFSLLVSVVISFVLIKHFSENCITFKAPITFVTGRKLFMQYDLWGTVRIVSFMLVSILMFCALPVWRIVSIKPLEALSDKG